MFQPKQGRRPVLVFRNRQRVRRVDLARLRKITCWLLCQGFGACNFELCVHLVGAAEITCLNEAFLGHAGATDVITFDHRALFTTINQAVPQGGGSAARCRSKISADQTFHGEIYISLDAAVAQARRFRTCWQSELTRYVIHGALHLAGYDDLQAAARHRMKREEDRLLRLASATFPLRRLART